MVAKSKGPLKGCFQNVNIALRSNSLVLVDALHHSQQIYSHVVTFPELNQYKAGDSLKMSCSRTQLSASSEAQISEPSIPSHNVKICIPVWV